MQSLTWQVRYLSAPQTLRHCAKCGLTREFQCTGKFRVNANQKYLDVWLIYRCTHCKTTWNLAIYERVKRQRLAPGLLERFHRNDQALAGQYAADAALLKRAGAVGKPPAYEIRGLKPDWRKTSRAELTIISPYATEIKLSQILRQKLGLSRSQLAELTAQGRVRLASGADLAKAKLQTEQRLLLQAWPETV